MDEATTSYELIRIENIQRNESFLKELGLSSPPTHQRFPTSNQDGEEGPKRKSKSQSSSKTLGKDHHVVQGDEWIPTRRSLRVATLAPVDYKASGQN